LITVVLESDTWQRDPDRHADYCDIVLLARLHQNIGLPHRMQLPAIDAVQTGPADVVFDRANATMPAAEVRHIKKARVK